MESEDMIFTENEFEAYREPEEGFAPEERFEEGFPPPPPGDMHPCHGEGRRHTPREGHCCRRMEPGHPQDDPERPCERRFEGQEDGSAPGEDRHCPHGTGHGPHGKGQGLCHRMPDDGSLPSLLQRCVFLLHHGGSASGQGRVLRLLSRAESMPQQELLMHLHIQPGSLSELIGKLEAKGLILRERDEQDRRKATIRITEAGRAAAQESQAGEDPFAVLTPEEQETLRALLTKLLADS